MIWTHNYLARKQAFNHLAKLTKYSSVCLQPQSFWYQISLQLLIFHISHLFPVHRAIFIGLRSWDSIVHNAAIALPEDQQWCVKRALIQSYSGPHFSRSFPHLDWIRRDTSYLSVFSPNAGKYAKNADQNNSEYGHIYAVNITGLLREILILFRKFQKNLFDHEPIINSLFN